MSPEEIANLSMAHEGICYRNSNLHPASAEESQSTLVAKSLLLDDTGKYLGDEIAIFGINISADNDTRAPSAFIREQNRIIGAAADGLADHSPDRGHVMKCNNNALFKLRKEDATLRGVHALTPKRIAMMNSDISATIDDYSKTGTGDPDAQKACLDQLAAIVPHHCGQHHLCRNERWCTYLRIQKEHPDWDVHSITVAAAAESNRPLNGKPMSLSEDGMSTITKEINKRFNKATIDKIANGGCSNLAENFWSVATKFSQGKRLSQDHSDHYEISNKTAFIRIGKGNVQKTHDEISTKLGLPISSTSRRHHALHERKMNKNSCYFVTDKAKAKRLIAKMTRLHKMGLVEKTKCHRTGKVPLKEDAKSWVRESSPGKGNYRKCYLCSICKQVGHNRTQCLMPPMVNRSKVKLVPFNIFDDSIEHRPGKCDKKELVKMVSADDWI